MPRAEAETGLGARAGRPEPIRRPSTDPPCQTAGRRKGRAPTGSAGALSSRRAPDRAAPGTVPRAGAGAAPLGKNTGNVSTPGAARRRTWALRDGVRPLGDRRASKCGRCRISPVVAIGMREGRARFYGLMRCGLAWACPVCRSVIQAERASEITQVVEWHRGNGGDGYLLTLTLRHGVGDDLKRLRRGVADAWRRMQGGRQWLDFKVRAGVVGTVRALETTHGAANGWHPHIHVLILAKKASPATVERWRSQLSVRWQRAIELTLGRDHLPTDRRGCDMRPSHQSDYLAKLGLELAGTSAKDGREGNRSPLEIGAHYAETRDLESAQLWRTYAKGMKRARMLTWSRGLRAAAGLGRELTDEEIVAEEEARDNVQMIVQVMAAPWDRLARTPGAAVRALELAETEGAAAAVAWIEEATGPPSQTDTLRDRFG